MRLHPGIPEQALGWQDIELALRMTPAMGAIYDAITDLMDACLKELRRSNKVLIARYI